MQNYCISQKSDGENLDEFDKMPAIHQSFPFYIPVNAFPMWPAIILSKFPCQTFTLRIWYRGKYTQYYMLVYGLNKI